MRKVSALARVLRLSSHDTANLLVHGGSEESSPQLQKSRSAFGVEEWRELQRIVAETENKSDLGRYREWRHWDYYIKELDYPDPSSAPREVLSGFGVSSDIVDAAGLRGVLKLLTKLQSLGDWHEAGERLRAGLHVSIRRDGSTDVLEYRIRITVSELQYHSYNLLKCDEALRHMLSSSGETAGLSWPVMLSRINEGKLGIVLSIDRPQGIQESI
jgi:hypothetical protein